MVWISATQRQRDEEGLANICGACGHPFTGTNPAVLTRRTTDHEGGSRIHRSHTTNPNDGFFGLQQ